ncbi:MAG: transcription elongation GreA/GreB family factor [Verrucomicrobiales bacterium]|jgi:transcription elongation GreA/GreB family factor
MEKPKIVAKIYKELRSQFERMLAAAQLAESYATDQDNQAESKYDTRALEASYLASGQAEKARELAEAVELFETLELPAFEETDPIDLGALVEGDLDGELVFYLIAPRGGGLVTEHEGCELTVLTPEAPLAQQLLGKRAGDELEIPKLKIYEVS